MTEYQAIENLGEMIEKLDNLSGAMQLPMPAEFHLKQLKAALPETSKELKKIYEAFTGENPWEESGE